MRKVALWVILPLIVLVAGCSRGWDKKTSITDTKFKAESCNKYFRLMDCVLDNDTDVSYTEEQREEIRNEVLQIQEQWTQLDDSILEESCNE